MTPPTIAPPQPLVQYVERASSLPDWVSPGIALVPVLLTLFLYWRELRSRRDLENRRQATAVTWWFGSAEDPRLTNASKLTIRDRWGYGQETLHDEEHNYWVALVISNATDSCLYLTRAFLRDGPQGELGIGTVPPGLSSGRLSVEAPHSAVASSRQAADMAFNEGTVQWLEFRDSGRRCWRRHADGRLVRAVPTEEINAERYHLA